MCGLNVLVNGSVEEVSAMNRAIIHRGTSMAAQEFGPFALGHVRLPILGRTRRFDQPFRKNGWTFLFVGEIVNFRNFSSLAESDIEVLADLWAEEGPDCVKNFDGFWSIAAVSHAQPHILHVVTDFLAKKPLYIYRDDRTLAVSSEIKAFGSLEGIRNGFSPLEPDPVYFSSVRKWGYHAGSRTWAQGVRKVPPGTYLKIDAIDLSIEVDDQFDIVQPDPFVDLQTAIIQAVDDRVLAADVPMAILLSGGLDSAIIYQAARVLNRPLKVYHIENGEREFLDLLKPDGEVVYLDANHKFGTDQELFPVLWANEGPVDLGSMIQQYSIGLKIKEDVCLSGDGADELFGGYRRAKEYDSQGSDIYDELVHYHLPRLDKMMMHGTVELRSPFLARRVLAGALALPWKDRTSKQYLKRAFEDMVPSAIIEAPKRPLKSAPVVQDQVAWRNRLCNLFLEIINDRPV